MALFSKLKIQRIDVHFYEYESTLFLRKLPAALKNVLISVNLRLTSNIKKWNLIFRFSSQLWLHQGSSMLKIISLELTKSWLVDLEHIWNVRMAVSWEEHVLLEMIRKAWIKPRANWCEISSVMTLKAFKRIADTMEQSTLISSGVERTKEIFDLLIDRGIRQLLVKSISKILKRTRSGFRQLLLLEDWWFPRDH